MSKSRPDSQDVEAISQRFAQLSHDDMNGNEDYQETSEELLVLRALLSTREAGIIIGKGGAKVAHLREVSGCKAGVSKVVQGVNDRVLTVSGQLEEVTSAYSIIAQTLLENPPSNSITSDTIVSIRLLISHNLMGTVIGRQGAKIKQIQDASGARMTASKEMLPQSTERVVEVQGNPEAIAVAVQEIGRCLLEDRERGAGTVLYNPAVRLDTATGRRDSSTGRRESNSLPMRDANIHTQNISIPSDMVGCIIGKGGSRISEIRRLSGSRISIAKEPHDDSGERMFTIQGTPESNEKALLLLYSQLEMEKERRLSVAHNADEDQDE
ncbi:uncharacterized protein VTP21DRAFT_9902 [Calcarisporiella thermophila]|uniref:uncharacterized protein n=1 Tax=Calcarisporiella thermophila TaxID=911321 RepID=UPI003741FF7D